MKRFRPRREKCRLSAFLPLFFFLFILLLPHSGSAHPLNNGYSHLTVSHNTVHYQLFIPQRSLPAYDSNHDGSLSADELKEHKPQIEAYLSSHLSLQNRTEEMRFTLLSMEPAEQESVPGIDFALEFTSSTEIDSLNIHYTMLFEDSDPDHLNMLVIQNGDDADQAVFDRDHRDYHYEPLVKPSLFSTLWRYLTLGVEHILSGYDHLLFLLSLVLAVPGIKSVLKIVTAFTAAHSITLYLASANILQVAPRWTESLIAASIVYVAAENLFAGSKRYRWLLTFGFGLIHGMGFAGALKDIGLPPGAFLASLFSFNIGVEIGQLAVVAVLLPVLLLLRKTRWNAVTVRSLSVVIGLIALFWFIERIGFAP
jgi:hypothetical protein